MHIQTKPLWVLSQEERDKLFEKLGLDINRLQKIRNLPPKERLLEAARTALEIDKCPNEDFIEWLAGYKWRGVLHHYYDSLYELLNLAKSNLLPRRKCYPKVRVDKAHLDILDVLPPETEFFRYELTDEGLEIWQKTKSKMRKVKLKRIISKGIFLVGIALYAGEGTKIGGKVEIVNSQHIIINLFLRF